MGNVFLLFLHLFYYITRTIGMAQEATDPFSVFIASILCFCSRKFRSEKIDFEREKKGKSIFQKFPIFNFRLVIWV